MDLKEFKNKFDPLLESFINKKVNAFMSNTSDPFIKEIVSHLKNLSKGGKRLRPYIAYLTYIALGGKEIDKALKTFVALEVFHLFALIHDDVMDKAETRHSIQTIHRFSTEKMLNAKRLGDLTHVGNSQGVLIGDLLLSWSTECLSSNKFPEKNLKKAKELFYQMVDEVILGQIIDVDIATRENPSPDLIEEKTRLKTSRYSFVRPMEIGGALANSDQIIKEFCEALGTRLGIAFQMQDDLLDIIGDPRVIHKNILGDISSHQHTFFTNYVFEHGTTKQKQKLNSYFGKNVKEGDKKEIQALFYTSGAINEGIKIIDENLNAARAIVTQSDLEDKNIFYDLIKILETRKS